MVISGIEFSKIKSIWMDFTISRHSSINMVSLSHFLYVTLDYDINRAIGDYIWIMWSFPVFLTVCPESLLYDFLSYTNFSLDFLLNNTFLSYFKIKLLLILSITSISILNPVFLLLMWKPPLSNQLKPFHMCITICWIGVFVTLCENIFCDLR